MRAWVPHLALVIVLIAQVAIARARHQTVEELEAQRASGSPQEQLDALHVLANRGTGRGKEFGIRLAKELYRSADTRLREFAFSTDICKHEYPLWQEMMVEARIPAAGVNAHWWRCYVILKRKVGGQIVGGSLRMRMMELRWFFDALRGEDPDEQAAMEHMMALQSEMQGRKSQ